MGTAGHVDHGKTALVKALTNIDCDTHKEEKSRGITINLGFAHLDLQNGNSIGIVDVPGHHAFVNTMVSGACGIDFVMLVVAADSGVMPQTIEHLRIMEILGIKKGFIVITKIDIAGEELIELLEEELLELVDGTFLENCDVLKVSSVNGKGINELKNYLSDFTSKIGKKKPGEIFRLFPDRIFNVKGHGIVVTGSVLGGSIKKEDKIFLLPTEKELRVRRLERHGLEAESIQTGDRASINLSGLSMDDLKKGMLLSDRLIESTQMIDVEVTLFQHNKCFELWTHVIFLLGTYQSHARIHLIDNDKLEPGESAIAQIHLDEPCMAQHGDRFVIRNTSNEITFGGGEVIDAHPLHHRRRPKKLIDQLKKITEGGITERIEAEVKKRLGPVSIQRVSEILDIPVDQLKGEIKSSELKEIIYVDTDKSTYFINRKEYESIRKKVLKNIENYHKRNPLDEGGRKFEELMGLFGVNRESASEEILNFILNEYITLGQLRKKKNEFVLSSHKIELSAKDKEEINFVETFHENSGLKVPSIQELSKEAGKKKISEEKLKQILQLLTSKGKLYYIDGNYLHSSIVNDSRSKLLLELNKNEDGITVAGFRDLIDGNRKICLLLLNQFDTEGITMRNEDLRFITEKGKQKLNK